MADNKITFFGKCDGISVEQLIRYGRFNMNVKHFHNQYEIFYIIEGERQFFFDNKSYNAYAGRQWMPPMPSSRNVLSN